MSVLIKENWDTARVAVPVSLEGKLTIETDFPGVPAQSGHYQGVRVNDLSPLWPVSQFRQRVLAGCALFVREMEKQGFQRLTAEADFRLWGPYVHKVANTGTDVTGTVTPKLTLKTLAHGHKVDEFPGLRMFIVKADFISTRTRVLEEWK